MVEYTCNKCFRTFDHKHNYLYHINRKISCVNAKDKLVMLINNRPNIKKNISDKMEELDKSITTVFNKSTILSKQELKLDQNQILHIYNQEFTEPICVYCNKAFMTNSHRNRHMNSNCDVRKKYIEMVTILDGELENVMIENKFLRAKYMNLFGENYIFPFGTEKFNSVDITLIANVVKNPYKGLPELVESFSFNALEQKYNNIRIKNPRGLHLEIFNGTNWVIETKENVIQTLIRTYKDIVDTEIENLNQILPSNLIKNYNDFSEFIDYYLSYIIFDTELTSIQKKYAKPIYQKLYTAMELMMINCFRKDIFHKIEEEIFNHAKRKIEEKKYLP